MPITDILKILFEKDTIGTIGKAISLLKKTPEWNKDLISGEYKFKGEDSIYKIELLFEFYKQVLIEKGWSSEKAFAVEFACKELIDNSFRFNKARKVKTKLEIGASSIYFKITIEDNGPGFNLGTELLKENSIPHGLNHVKKIADKLYQNNKNSITAIFRKDKGEFRTISENEIEVFSLSGKIDRINALVTESIKEELNLRINDSSELYGLIIDLSEVKFIDSSGMGMLLSTLRKCHINGIYLILVVPTSNDLMEMFRLLAFDNLFEFASSVEDAKKRIKQKD